MFPVFAPPFLGIHGTVMAQSNAIAATLAKELGLTGKTPGDEAHALQLAMNTEDILNDLFANKGPERLQKWLTHIQECLEISGSGYMVGKDLTYADFTNFVALEFIAGKEPQLIEAMPKVKAFMQMIAGLKGVKEFKAKGIPLMPPKAPPKSKM
eukprot:gnl/MRDRNA2_/MRDRNA2_77733_c0_seq1.p1 gnl/MRDRNA2_/MRDRNA2_77733_c0~~gnl/MRDRNA2_/MRDRNA2_77733_c0_seq1.p1  ORF type:complete len:154 (+),score=45.32 gnl/MRDRNA2_/MRDRNA2_77733_c0_seq1:102-563(+)